MDEWARIVQQHGQAVYRCAWRLLGNEADAADCFQDVFVSAVKVSRQGSVRSWPALLHRLVTVRALDMLRRRGRSVPCRDGCDARELPSPQATPLAQAQANELADRLRHALPGLPAKQAQVFCLRVLDELSYQEIADAMELSPSQVGVLLHRARARLRELLDASEVRHE